MRFETVQFRAYREGRLSAAGQAAEVAYFRNSGEIAARGVTVDLPQDVGAPVRVTAPEVSGDVPGRAFQARGGVRATRGADEARTASARYADADGLVRGEEAVEIEGPGYRLAGPAFTLDPRAGELTVRGGVRLVATPGGARR